jgi:2-polyprenyl-3-methyl-5-hydroxy-6-metoxy-1,4-benzoquinol methylase
MVHQAQSEEDHLREEAEYADAEYRRLGGTNISPLMFKKYEHPTQMWDWRQRVAALLHPLAGKRLLDYGCGQGEEAAYFAKLGARVTAIDISQVGLQVGRDRAKANGLAIDFRFMNCLRTEFSDESFDIVHGSGILHHLGLKNSLREVQRLLVPGGVGAFLEPLQSGQASERAKAALSRTLPSFLGITPVTSGEENLRWSELDEERSNWSEFVTYPYRLTYRLRKLLLLPRPVWNLSLRLDHLVLSLFPRAQQLAGAVVIFLRK